MMSRADREALSPMAVRALASLARRGPGSISCEGRVLSSLIRRGYVAPLGPDAFTITNKGREALGMETGR